MSFVCCLEQFLTPEECEQTPALFGALEEGAAHTRREGVRRSRVAFLDPDTPEKRALEDKIVSVVLRANAEVYQFDLDGGRERLQLAEYAEGGQYGWHLDIGRGESALRKLSATVQLSPPESYGGGDVEFWNTPAASRAQGTIIIFPSYLPHRVHPVTRGVRRSLVVWMLGARPYR